MTYTLSSFWHHTAFLRFSFNSGQSMTYDLFSREGSVFYRWKTASSVITVRRPQLDYLFIYLFHGLFKDVISISFYIT
jgi:hypothetical protein